MVYNHSELLLHILVFDIIMLKQYVQLLIVKFLLIKYSRQCQVKAITELIMKMQV